MTEIRSKWGRTISQSIESSVYALDDLGIGLEDLLSSGRIGFGLSGDALIDYIRRTLHAVIAAGRRVATRRAASAGATAESMSDDTEYHFEIYCDGAVIGRNQNGHLGK